MIKMKIFGVLKDIINYFTILRFIRKNKDTKDWKFFKFRSDWIGRIYTVINLTKDEFNEPEDVRQIRLIEHLAPMTEYFANHNMSEILRLKLKQIPNTYSYLVLFLPMFYYLNFKYIFIRISVIAIIIYLYFFLKKFTFFQNLLNYLNYLKF